jgi:hypothetical protein
MLFELKYPGLFLAAALVSVYFIVKFYLGKEELSAGKRNLLFILKYLFISMLILFFFEPEIVKTGLVEKPERHLLLFDNSRSLTLNDPADTLLMKNTLSKFIGDDSFVICSFGRSTELLTGAESLKFKDDFTNISGKASDLFLEKITAEKNIRSQILFTDGNFSDADNFSLKNNVPVNIVYSSPSSPEPDIFIDELIYQDDPAGESKFVIVAGYRGPPVAGKFDLRLMENGKVIKTVSQKIPGPGTFTTVKTDLPEISGGFRETEFVIDHLKNEKNRFNNRKTAYQKKPVTAENILIIARSPSLDLTFLTKMLISGGYSFRVVYENSVSDSLISGGYSSLISLGSPSRNSPAKTDKFISAFPAKLVFINENTDLVRLERIINAGITGFRYIPAEGRLQENSEGSGGFLLTRSSAPVVLNGLPEAVYNSALQIDEKRFVPLLLMSNSPLSKAVYQRSEGTANTILVNLSSFWKIAFNDDGNNFSRLIFNLTDLLSADRSTDRIKIFPSKDEYYSGEKIIFRGRILDEKLEPAANAEASVFVNENSLSSGFTYSNKEYSAEMMITRPGLYTADITVKTGGGSVKKKVSFRVMANDLETQLIGADTLFLKNFVSARNGTIIPLSRADQYLDGLRGKTETAEKTVRYNLTRNMLYFIILAAVFLAELAYRKHKDLS